MLGNLYLMVLAMVTGAFYKCDRGFRWVRLEKRRKPLPVEYLISIHSLIFCKKIGILGKDSLTFKRTWVLISTSQLRSV